MSGIVRRLGSGMTALVVAGLVTTGLSACVEQQLAAEPGSPDTGATQPLYPGEKPTPAVEVTAEQTKGLVSTPWVLVGTTGKEVTIRYIGGDGCSSFRGIRLEQTSKHVELWSTVKVDSAGPCTSNLLLGVTTVHLRTELGRRMLLHAPVSADWQKYANNL